MSYFFRHGLTPQNMVLLCSMRKIWLVPTRRVDCLSQGSKYRRSEHGCIRQTILLTRESTKDIWLPIYPALENRCRKLSISYGGMLRTVVPYGSKPFRVLANQSPLPTLSLSLKLMRSSLSCNSSSDKSSQAIGSRAR